MARAVPTVVRFGALLSAGAFGVHQLRYLLAYGDGAGGALHATGHAYLVFAEPAIGLLLAFAVGQAVAAVARGSDGGVELPRRRLAALLGAALLAIYTGQELVEGALDPGHANGLPGVFGDGGWIAAPLAAAIGALLACTVRVVGAVAERARLRGLVALAPHAPRAHRRQRRPRATDRPRRTPLADRRAGRAPPSRLLTA